MVRVTGARQVVASIPQNSPVEYVLYGRCPVAKDRWTMDCGSHSPEPPGTRCAFSYFLLLSLSVAVAHPAAGNFVEGLVDTDVCLSSRGCVFEVSVVLPSGATITLEGNHNTDTVGSLVAELSHHPELEGHAFYAMHGGSYLKEELTLQDYNVQPRSELRVLHRDALLGGTGAADAYMATHRASMESAINGALQHVLSMQPSDPVCALAEYLAARSAQGAADGVPESPSTSSPPASEAAGAAATSTAPTDDAEKLHLPSEEEEGASDKWSLVAWLAGARVHRAVAGAILRSARARGLSDSSEDSLAFVRGLKDRAELAKLIRADATLEALTDLAWDEVTTLQKAGAATTSEVQSKFAGAVELSYGGLDSFFGGLEGVVGSPNPKLLEAMADDHMNNTESTNEYLTGNCEARRHSNSLFVA